MKGVSRFAIQAWIGGISWWSPGPVRTDCRRIHVEKVGEFAARTIASASAFYSSQPSSPPNLWMITFDSPYIDDFFGCGPSFIDVWIGMWPIIYHTTTATCIHKCTYSSISRGIQYIMSPLNIDLLYFLLYPTMVSFTQMGNYSRRMYNDVWFDMQENSC